MTWDKPKVLIIEDDEAVGMLMEEQLHELGYECARATSVANALAKLEQGGFRLVLTDIRLPGMSGLDLLRKIRSLYPDVMTIVLTAVDEVSTAVEAMKAGAFDYIVKPFSLANVNKSIVRALQGAN
jgi:two-component system response regulator AtoC